MYKALFNNTYVPNKLEAIYIKDPTRYLGPFYLAGLIAYFFFAIVAMQVHYYYRTFKKDSIWQKIHVGVMMITVILKSAQVFVALWKREVYDWGNFYELTQIEEASKLAALSTAIVTAVVQVFFILRCFKLSNRNYFFAVPAALGVLLNVGTAIWFIWVMPTNFAVKSPMFSIASKVWPISSLVTDCIITSTTLYTLLRVRDKAISRRSINIISNLITLTLETAIPPLITTCLDVSFTGQLNGPNVFMFLVMTAYFQAFSMMYTINSRTDILDRTDVESSGMSSSWKGRVNAGSYGPASPVQLRNVHINVDSATMGDTTVGPRGTSQWDMGKESLN